MTYDMFMTGQSVDSVATKEEFWAAKDRYKNGKTEVKRVYGPEMQELVLELLEPRAQDFVVPSEGLTRCPGSKAGDLSFVHSDFPNDHLQFEHYNKYIVDENLPE